MCDAARGFSGLRARGGLAFVIAGNGYFDTAGLSAGRHPDAYRIGAVKPDGSTCLPEPDKDPDSFSPRAYDLTESYVNKIAVAGSDDEYAMAGGTSGSTPRVAGRAAALLGLPRAARRRPPPAQWCRAGAVVAPEAGDQAGAAVGRLVHLRRA